VLSLGPGQTGMPNCYGKQAIQGTGWRKGLPQSRGANGGLWARKDRGPRSVPHMGLAYKRHCVDEQLEQGIGLCWGRALPAYNHTRAGQCPPFEVASAYDGAAPSPRTRTDVVKHGNLPVHLLGCLTQQLAVGGHRRRWPCRAGPPAQA